MSKNLISEHLLRFMKYNNISFAELQKLNNQMKCTALILKSGVPDLAKNYDFIKKQQTFSELQRKRMVNDLIAKAPLLKSRASDLAKTIDLMRRRGDFYKFSYPFVDLEQTSRLLYDDMSLNRLKNHTNDSNNQ